MTEKINRWRVGIILLFVMAFTVIGWSAPMVVAAHIPQDQVMEVHNFQAQNATTNASSHYVYLDRMVHRSATAATFTELYIISDSGERFEMHTNNIDTYFQEGHEEVVVTMNLPEEDTIEGTYRYVLVANFQLANGRVERTFTFESDRFVINDSVNMTDSPIEFAEECENDT